MKQIEFWMLGLKSSATMTSELEALLELSANKAYFYEAYDSFKMVATLKQQMVLISFMKSKLYWKTVAIF
nr:dead-box atp-dependent rna helicase 36 [Quercus suber]